MDKNNKLMVFDDKRVEEIENSMFLMKGIEKLDDWKKDLINYNLNVLFIEAA